MGIWVIETIKLLFGCVVSFVLGFVVGFVYLVIVLGCAVYKVFGYVAHKVFVFVKKPIYIINYPRGRAPGFVTVHRYRRPDTASRL